MNQITTRTNRLTGTPVAATMLASLNSDRSRTAYRKELDRFDDWRQDRILNRQTTLEYVQAAEKDGLAASTINRRLAAIRAFVREAELSGVIPHEVAAPILAVKDRKGAKVKDVTWLERGQVTEILKLCDGSAKSKRDRALFALAVSTGLRRAELASLDWTQLKRRKRKDWLIGVKVKGGGKRDLVIQDSAMKWLKAWRGESGRSGAIFKQIRKSGQIIDKGISGRTVTRIVEALCDEIGEKAAAHDLRRTFANLLDEAGVPIREIQLLLGHSSVVTTERYLKPIHAARAARSDYFTF